MTNNPRRRAGYLPFFARFRLAGVLLAVVVLYGTAGYVLVEHWNLVDSAYMTLITISTVGYGEVHPLSGPGRLFTATLIVGGVGTMLYAFGTLAEALAEGELANFRRLRVMNTRLGALRDHFIVCGYGRIGTQIMQEFASEKIPCVVIENNSQPLGRLVREGRMHVEGDAASEEVLRDAGIERAKGLICAVDSDERAVYITLAARALRPELYIVARAGQPESVRRLELAGADRVISPYRMAGHMMADLALRPAMVDVIDSLHHGDSDIGLEECLVPAGSRLAGRSLTESGLLGPAVARLLAVRRSDGDLHVAPEGELVLEEGDLIIALGSRQQLLATADLVN